MPPHITGFFEFNNNNNNNIIINNNNNNNNGFKFPIILESEHNYQEGSVEGHYYY